MSVAGHRAVYLFLCKKIYGVKLLNGTLGTPEAHVSLATRIPGPEKKKEDFPDSPLVKTSPPNARGVGSIPSQGAKMPHASRPKNSKHKTEAILQEIQ